MAELDRDDHLDPDQVPLQVGAPLVRAWRIACVALGLVVVLLLLSGVRHLQDGSLLPTLPGETPVVQGISGDPHVVVGASAALHLPTRPAATAAGRGATGPSDAVVRISATQPARHLVLVRPAF